MMEGFRVNTYKWVNADGKAFYVKYHWKPKLGVRTLDRQEATKLAGEDSNYLTRDLYDAIERGEPAEYELYVRLMDPADEFSQDFDPLDPTKTWPEDKFPLMPVGTMTLDRNPENYLAEVEQAAFCPASIGPGIDLSADKLLQGRFFFLCGHAAARLGPNYLVLGAPRQSRPRVAVHNNQRDGAIQFGAFSGTVNYEPSSLAGDVREAPAGPESTLHIEADVTRRKISLMNDFAQAGAKYRSLDTMDQDHLIDNIVDSLCTAEQAIQEHMVANLSAADRELGTRVVQGLKRQLVMDKTA